MKPISDAVVTAVQAVLRLERQAFSSLHDCEHAMQYGGFAKLAGWFDKRVADARCRRRGWLDWLFARDEIPDPDPGDPEAASLEPLANLKAAQEGFEELLDRYRELYKTAFKAGDAATCEKAGPIITSLEKMLVKIEVKLALHETLGDELWTAKVAIG